MKKNVILGKIFVNFFLFLVLFDSNLFSQSVQNFGTTTGSLASGSSASFIPNPTTSGSTYARIGSGNGSINMITSPNPLGTSGTFIRASAPTNSSVNKISPIIGSTGGTTFYSRFKVIFGDALAGSSATSGEWYAIFGDGSTFGNSSTFNSSQTFSGFRFTYGAGGNITFENRNGSNWDQSSINSAYSTLKSGIYYDFEIVGNNKSSGTVNYAYNGVSQSVAINRFDLYINGFLVGNDLSKSSLSNNSSIKSVMFYGRNSTSNVANIFLDDVSFQNSIPTSIQRLTNPSSFDLSASNYSFTDWPSTSSIGTYPSNMIFHWGNVNSVDPTLPNTATQDYVWGYNYTDQSRITGLGANGFSFINSSPGRVSTTSGNCGEAVVSLKTSCRNNVQVSWTAARLTNNGIRYLVRAQYRVGNTGAYTDLPGATSAIEFNSANAGPTNFGPITLPSACENQPEVQIRWVYYSSGSGSGSRDEIRLDDISISSSSLTAAPTGITAQSFCSANSPTIANLIATGTSIKWYAAVSGGSALLSSVSLVTGTTYYATQTVNGCESTSRFAVTATINSNPSAPTGTATQSFYSASYPTIANLSATGTSKKWYSFSSGGSELLTSLALANGTTYYATQTVNGCESTSRLAVTATLSADLPSNVSACDSYILPALSVGNYFTGSNGTGTALSAGTVINASQTLYVYVANGSYSNENSFEITINATPTVDSPSDVSVCNSYTLPALTVGNYFTGTNGTGTAMTAGDAITTSQTIYVYASNGSCADENSFNVTINATPTAASPSNVSVCDSYTLPSLSVGNYFTGSNGTGTAMTAGDAITSSQTIYVYAENGTCTDENSFEVTINATPTADSQSNVSVCDLYTLPALTVGNYFTGTNGSGTALFAGDAITSSQTIYVYAENGTCTDENSFEVTINATPTADSQSNVSVCDLYTLPALTFGNYFTGTNGTGTAMTAGDAITTSQTIYVYASNGSCADENSFNVTINATPTADSPSNVSVCDSYTLPALLVGNYFTGSNGTGTAMTAGDAITSSQTIYVYASNGTCTNENSFEVNINATPTVDSPSDVSVCDSYTLPALTIGNYFTSTNGTGTALSEGTAFTSSQTIYVYASNGSCTNESSFVVTINATPTVDSPSDVSVCDSYTLPALTIGNYFTGTNGSGTALFAGDVVSSSQTIYVYASNGSCTNENSFEVTINATPTADSPSDVSVCDSYTLPALTVGNYFTGSNGTGTAITAGDAITSSQTIYVYAANGSCADENSFNVTINVTPTVDSPSDVSVCDSYTLPALTVGNYFTGTNGSGTTLFAGDVVTSSQTIYVYASNGSCEDENSFEVTINTTPSITGTLSASRCDAGTLTLEATPSAGTINWFTAAAGGSSLFTGTIFTTPSISTTTTYFAQVDNGSCTNNTRTAVIAIIGGCSKIQASQCGTTLANNTSAILATTVVGATNYRFEISGPNGYLEVLNSTSRWFYLSSLPSYELGQTYSIRVQTSVNGGVTYREYGQACTITTFFPTTQLQSSQCGATLTSNASALIANTIVGATNYRFEVSGPNGYLETVTTTSRWFYLSNLPSYDLGQTYSVRVQTSYNNGASYGPYGSSCNITTFFPTTQLPASQCGITLTTDNSAIVANLVTDATNYRFEVTGPNGYYQLISKTIRQLYMSDLATYERGQTYSIRVCLSFNNGLVYGPFGSTCNITTSHPRTQIQTSQCGATLTNNTTAIAANSITGVANYRFEVSGPNGYLQVVTKTVRQLFLSDLPSYELGQTYSIRVQLRLTNAAIYGPYGTACNITTASTMPLAPNSNIELKSMNEPTFDFEAFPNPSNGDFTISSSEAGTFNIINELGQLVRTVEITEANGNQERVENMPNGAYFVTGTLNGEVVTKKVMVVR